MRKEEGRKAGGGELDWALLDQVGHGEQFCPPPESMGELSELRRPEWITVVNRSLQSLVRRGWWAGGGKEAEKTSRWEMMGWEEAMELERENDSSSLGR